jgi:hypothetical protein
MIATRSAHVGRFVIPSFLQPDRPTGSDSIGIPHDIPEFRTREYLPCEGKNTVQGMCPSPPFESEKVPSTPRRKDSKSPEEEVEPGNSKNAQLKRQTDLGEGGMATVKTSAGDAVPAEDEWSLPILFGSEASLQRFSLIHRLLKEEWNVRVLGDQVSLTDFLTIRSLTPQRTIPPTHRVIVTQRKSLTKGLQMIKTWRAMSIMEARRPLRKMTTTSSGEKFATRVGTSNVSIISSKY